jgi:hypothetical protein
MTTDKLICSGLLLLTVCLVVFVPMEGSHATWLESLGSGLSGALFALFKGANHTQQENKIEKSEVSIAQG